MANARDITLRLLISARDNASAVLGRVRSALGSMTSGVARVLGDIRTQVAALIGSFGLLKTAADAIGAAGDLEALRAQFAALEGSVTAGTAKLQELEASFGLRQIGAARTLYADLAAFGLKPTVDQLKSLIDFNARTGKGAENLNGIVAQLGQAWGKEKLQYEDILILLERGVPIWQLLSNATGVATQQLAEMASNGELGRKAITLLIAEMGKVAQGASVARLETWNGLVESAQNLWKQFLATLAQGGAFQQAKQYLADIATWLESAITDGRAAEWGRQIGEATREIADKLRTLVTDARAVWSEWTTALDGWGATTTQVLNVARGAWLGFRAVVEATGAGIATVLGLIEWRTAAVLTGLSKLGIVSEETATKARASYETHLDAVKNYTDAAKQHWNEAEDAFSDAVEAQEKAGKAGADAAKAATGGDGAAGSQGAEAWRLDQAALNKELAQAGVLITEVQANTAGAGTALQGAATNAKLGADALRDHASASKVATKASSDLQTAQESVNKALAERNSAKGLDAESGWMGAALAAAQATSQLNAGQPDQALSSLANAWSLLDTAISEGDTSASLEDVARRLNALTTQANAAKEAVDGVSGSGDGAGKGAADASGGAAATARDAVQSEFAKPITLTFDVAAAAQTAATTVADAIANAVTARLSGLALSVPVTAVVTVDAGGADLVTDLTTEAAKRGSKQ